MEFIGDFMDSAIFRSFLSTASLWNWFKYVIYHSDLYAKLNFLFLTCKDNGNNLDSQIFSAQSFVVCCFSTLLWETDSKKSSFILLCPYDNISPYSAPLSQIPHSVATTQRSFIAILWSLRKSIVPLLSRRQAAPQQSKASFDCIRLALPLQQI